MTKFTVTVAAVSAAAAAGYYFYQKYIKQDDAEDNASEDIKSADPKPEDAADTSQKNNEDPDSAADRKYVNIVLDWEKEEGADKDCGNQDDESPRDIDPTEDHGVDEGISAEPAEGAEEAAAKEENPDLTDVSEPGSCPEGSFASEEE